MIDLLLFVVGLVFLYLIVEVIEI